MPANRAKRCSLCGRKGHNLRGCTLPGAANYRRLLLERVSAQKAQNGRKLRGTKRAWELAESSGSNRKPKQCQRMPRKGHMLSRLARSIRGASCNTPTARPASGLEAHATLSEEDAVRRLQEGGFMQTAGDCEHCRHGTLVGPVMRSSCGQKGQVYYRCSNERCRRWKNAMALAKWLPFQRHRTLTPSKLLCFLHTYLSATCPKRLAALLATGLHEQLAQRIGDALRACLAFSSFG